MRMQVIQFNYGIGGNGGSATIYIFHDQKISAFDSPSYLSLDCGYHLTSQPPQELPDNHAAVPIPGSNTEWIDFGVITPRPLNWPQNLDVPAINEYKYQAARLIANMVATATLGELTARIPTVIF